MSENGKDNKSTWPDIIVKVITKSENVEDKKANKLEMLLKFCGILALFIPLYVGVNTYKMEQENRKWEQIKQFLVNFQDSNSNKHAYMFILSIWITEQPNLAKKSLLKMLKNPSNSIEDKADILQALSEIEDHSQIEIYDMDFSSINLSGVKLDNFKFAKCRFDNSLLEYTQFSNINFISSSFNGAYLNNASFNNIDLRKTSFYLAKLNDTQFLNVFNFEGANFSNSYWGVAKLEDEGLKRYLNDNYSDIKHKGDIKGF
jgi:uncharacterized protein YjbI with pentapeptide repeats